MAMASRLRSRATFANLVSVVALFLALGGSAYAVTIAKNSVGARQIKKNAVAASEIRSGAVRSAEVKDSSLLGKDFAPGELPAGPKGEAGPSGATGATGATGSAGPKGDSFDTGLPSGRTLRGTYAVTGQAAPSGGFSAATAVTYAAALPANPTLHMVLPDATPSAVCPGTFVDPQAAPGNLCVYESPNHGNLITDPVAFLDPLNPTQGKLGFYVVIQADRTGIFTSLGTWAVTAP